MVPRISIARSGGFLGVVSEGNGHFRSIFYGSVGDPEKVSRISIARSRLVRAVFTAIFWYAAAKKLRRKKKDSESRGSDAELEDEYIAGKQLGP